ncbi:MAG: DUF4438 domain-containing protein [Deltaproteobacteria bacterium]|uniref:DUF4438 domain-containing protein n=1 Tax=Desulfobacula sp. TaxID=2593537 RepID=UPI0019AD9DD1|nr:DUF4438 domain-containing protein [Candidatus Desulfobacula maris]MBL6995921.1 DUF4438 domain-containing protein [Desulfobacula sp.]
MLKTNEDRLVELAMQCKPGPPRIRPGWKVDYEGKPFILPSIGGITLNIQVGASAFGLAGDHIEPGVSCTANAEKPFEFPNNSLQLLSCVGNVAIIVSGDAKGEKGVVIGHHGGSEHVMIDFPKKVLEQLTYDDKIMIRTKGQGLKLMDYPDIKLFNLDPGLLKKMKIKKMADNRLKVPVTTIVPAQCMGSGLGSAHVAAGDYDVMTSDPDTVKKYKLDRLKFGDFVALLDHDNSYGRAFVKGAISIGIVVHSDCLLAGHGPGISTLMTCSLPLIEPVLDAKANISDLLQIGTKRKKSSPKTIKMD